MISEDQLKNKNNGTLGPFMQLGLSPCGFFKITFKIKLREPLTFQSFFSFFLIISYWPKLATCSIRVEDVLCNCVEDLHITEVS